VSGPSKKPSSASVSEDEPWSEGEVALGVEVGIDWLCVMFWFWKCAVKAVMEGLRVRWLSKRESRLGGYWEKLWYCGRGDEGRDVKGEMES